MIGNRMIARQVRSDGRDPLFGIVIVRVDARWLSVQATKRRLGYGKLHPGPTAPVSGPILQEIELPPAEQLRIRRITVRR